MAGKKKLVFSRERAKALILAGQVRVNSTVADKPGRLVLDSDSIQVLEDDNPYVGRGGLKLKHALDHFQINPQNITALDIGASTGGFTDCLLQKGAAHVIAVDVGYGQLDWKLQKDPRVRIMDRVNARYLTAENFEDDIDLVVMDLSFISLKLVLPAVFEIAGKDSEVVTLVKPQFEVGKEEVENKGVIKDPLKQLQSLMSVAECVTQAGWMVSGVTASPITGQKGNREFFLHCVQQDKKESVSESEFRKVVELD